MKDQFPMTNEALMTNVRIESKEMVLLSPDSNQIFLSCIVSVTSVLSVLKSSLIPKLPWRQIQIDDAARHDRL